MSAGYVRAVAQVDTEPVTSSEPGTADQPTPARSTVAMSVVAFFVVVAVGLLAAVSMWPGHNLIRLVFWLAMALLLFATGLVAAVSIGLTTRPNVDQSTIPALFRSWFSESAADSQDQRRGPDLVGLSRTPGPVQCWCPRTCPSGTGATRFDNSGSDGSQVVPSAASWRRRAIAESASSTTRLANAAVMSAWS